MAKNANFVSHKKSKQIVDGKPKLPLASDIVEGEIAINFGKDVETLSIKNESGDVVTFSSDNYYTEQKLGSGFTGENSGRTVTEALENMEINVDQVLDDTTSASTNPVSSKAVYKAATDNELVWTNAFVALSGTVSAHTENTEIHVTAADKTAWNAKVDASAIANFFDDAKYELSGTTHVINFYNGSTVKATIDADDFIKDGMISAVTLDTKSGTTYLVIEWNTDAGIQTTELNIGDLFEADNYYTKSQTSGATELTAAFSTKANTATTLAGYGITDAYTKSETSGATEISNALGNKVDNTEYATFSAATNAAIEANATNIANNKAAIEANATNITSLGVKVAANKTAINANAANIANNKAAIQTHTADTTAHITAAERTSWKNAATNSHTHSNKSTLDAITASSTAINSLTGAVGTMAYQNTSSYSSATQVNTALAGKSGTGHTHASSAVTAMTGYAKAASGSSVTTSDTLNQAIGKLEGGVDDVKSALGGLKLVEISQNDYDNLGTKDPHTLYVIND